MNAQGQKTGGRQKGTPNKITASVKYMFKALMMNNYDLVEDSFQKAKPNERLTFIAKMTPFLCAKEQPSKNGGEWVMGESMDHEWFQMYESDHILRRKQRIQFEENYAFQELNYRHQCEYELLTNMVRTAKNASMNLEDLCEMTKGEFEAFYADAREDRRRLRDSFQQRRDNFMKIEQEFFNDIDAKEEETEEVAKEETAKEEAPKAKSEVAKSDAEKEEIAEVAEEEIAKEETEAEEAKEEVKAEQAKAEVEANQQSSLETQNLAIPLSRCPENPHLNSSTLDSATAQSAVKAQRLNPSTLDPKPSSQKPHIRHLRQQQHHPFYTAIANKRHR